VTTLKIGGREFKLVPFTIEIAEQVFTRSDEIDKIEPVMDKSRAIVDHVCELLKLGQNEVDAAWLKKNVNFGDLPGVYREIMVAGGAKTAAEGEAGSP
jgi:hypothetical protein